MAKRLIVVLVTIAIILTAGWVMLRRPDISYTTLEAVYANADSRFLKADQTTKLHFRDIGPREAPVIVLVHGYSASLHTWEAWASDLRRDYRIISFDLPGHGLSRCIDNEAIGIEQFVDAINTITQSLDVERFTLVGSSMGGHTAWAYALEYPEKLEGLVLVDAAGWLETAEEAGKEPFVFKLLRNDMARNLMKDFDMSALIRDGLEKSFTDTSLVTDEMVERYSALARAPCHRDALLTLASGTTLRVLASEERLSAILTPTLVMQGEDDNLVPAAHARKFVTAIPNAVLKTYPEVGHIPQEEIPAQSVQDLRAFLETPRRQAIVEDAEVTRGQ